MIGFYWNQCELIFCDRVLRCDRRGANLAVAIFPARSRDISAQLEFDVSFLSTNSS
jgi:hypothetical protein